MVFPAILPPIAPPPGPVPGPIMPVSSLCGRFSQLMRDNRAVTIGIIVSTYLLLVGMALTCCPVIGITGVYVMASGLMGFCLVALFHGQGHLFHFS